MFFQNIRNLHVQKSVKAAGLEIRENRHLTSFISVSPSLHLHRCLQLLDHLYLSVWLQMKIIKRGKEQRTIPEFCLLQKSPFNFCFTWQKQNTVNKRRYISKLKDKRTSATMVQDQYPTYTKFPTFQVLITNYL